jgi:hypothetical protein
MAFLIGLDLGQSMDYSALVVMEQTLRPPAQPTYAVRHLVRWPLDTAYPRIIQDVVGLLAWPPLVGRSELLADRTGCGAPVIDSLRQAGLTLVAVSLHGGDTVSHTGLNYRTPKRDVVGAVQVVLQQRRLHFAEALPLTAVLTQELLNFKVKIDPATAHDSYSAWRERDHDDLVLALALAVWWGEMQAGSRVPALSLAAALQGMTKRSLGRFGPRSHSVPPAPGPQDDVMARVEKLWGLYCPWEDDY